MLTHDQIREELIRQLETGAVAASTVARHLNIAPARVTEMRKRLRKVQQAEMPKLAVLLGLSDDAPALRQVEDVAMIPDWGRVAQGVWLEQSEPDPDGQRAVAYDRMRGDPSPTDLFAVTLEGTSMNQAFTHPDTQLICRRTNFGTGQFRSGDYVIVQRTAHDLHELTCKRVDIDDDGVFWLCPESDDPRFQEPWRIGKPDTNHHHDNEVVIIGRVIRAVRDFERR